jgi:hypothetical protein
MLPEEKMSTEDNLGHEELFRPTLRVSKAVRV